MVPEFKPPKLFSLIRKRRLKKRGLAQADQETRKRVASLGGSSTPSNLKNDPKRASELGTKGGAVSGGNFKKDPERARRAGRRSRINYPFRKR